MAIRKIRISNFKSFKDLEVDLGTFNVLIGANASGKSNFIQVFGFLRDIRSFGLDNAISMQGGVEYLTNMNIGPSTNFVVEVISDEKTGVGVGVRARPTVSTGIKVSQTTYGFGIKFGRGHPGFAIADEKVVLKCEFVKLRQQRGKIVEEGKYAEGDIVVSRAKGRFNVELPEGALIKEEDILPPFIRGRLQQESFLLLERPFFFLPMPSVLGRVSLYDFDTKLPKKAMPITGKAELEEDGSNLAIVLKNIIEDKGKERKFSNLVKDLLPFVDAIDVEKFADKSLLFKLREIYCRDRFIPASLLSDGTISITALIIALYFEKKSLTIIEEPERNIHPYLISKVVNMMREASQRKQIIVTTHNPEIIRHVDLNDILLVSRNKEGFSFLSRPSEKEEIKSFLEHDMGIEDLYVQNLLELQA